MTKIFYRFFITIFIILLCAVTYLSTIGISTNVFNSNISKQIKKIDKNLDIDLNKIFIILNPLQFKINLKTPQLHTTRKIILASAASKTRPPP